MAPIAKENDTLTLPAEAPAACPSAGSSDAKPQPVALEVPVIVNGARSVDGSDKREPFSESTKTILVFGNGAVIRLESSVAPGQLLFLTNEKTKKEVVCQVVKSKNYRSISGYVELEFTEPVAGFWGMRFSGDRIAPQAPAAATGPKLPEAKPASVPAKTVAAPPTPKPAGTNPDATANFNALKSLISAPVQNLNATHVPAPSKPQGAATLPETKPVAHSAAQNPAATSKPAASDSATEALKQQTARLQEQLSSMLFEQTPAPKAPSAGGSDTNFASSDATNAARIFEFANSQPETPKPSVDSNSAIAPPARKSVAPASAGTHHQDELQIPSWLAPLAHNAANPSSAAENPAKGDVLSEPPIFEEHIASELPASPRHDAASEIPAFSGGLLSQDSSLSAPPPSAGAGKGLKLLAVAAGVLVAAAAGTWYVRTSQPAAPTTVAASSAPAVTTRVPEPATSTPARAAAAEPVTTSPVTSIPAKESSSVPEPTPAATHTITPAPPSHAAASPKTNAPQQVRAEEPKKPSLGEVRLAAPTVTPSARGGGSDEVPAVDFGAGEPAASNGLGAVLPSSRKQPAVPPAPIPVGGDVKQARLISSTPPIYPLLAKTQRVSGNVVIDALIDATGRVTTMKVVSGPTLLHQAAMDALRQWKYQPATLDGKPVPMHLTVSIQFRLE